MSPQDTIVCSLCKGSGRIPTAGHLISYVTIHTTAYDAKYRYVDGVLDPIAVSMIPTGLPGTEEVLRKAGYYPNGLPIPGGPAWVNMPDPNAIVTGDPGSSWGSTHGGLDDPGSGSIKSPSGG